MRKRPRGFWGWGMSKETCLTCKFWERGIPMPSATTCHRYPQSYHENLMTTHRDYWCGEYKPKKKEGRDE